MKEMNACKVRGEIKAISKAGLSVETVGVDNQDRPWPDLHLITATADQMADLKAGDFVEVTGRIMDIPGDQFIQAGLVAKADKSAGYLNVAKVKGVIAQETMYYPRKVNADGKLQQQFSNVTLKSLGTKIFGTIFGNLAADWKQNGPIGSEVQLYGRMRRKELEGLNGKTRKWIDIASDDFNYPGLSKILKRGAGAKDEFATMSEDVLAFTGSADAPKAADPKPKKDLK